MGSRRLVAIKLAHTAIWAALAACILAIPFEGLTGHYRWAALSAVPVAVECFVLIANGWRCPLTDVAGRYTEERAANFDIYLPLWIARRNKEIFVTLFLLGEGFVLLRWLFVSR